MVRKRDGMTSWFVFSTTFPAVSPVHLLVHLVPIDGETINVSLCHVLEVQRKIGHGLCPANYTAHAYRQSYMSLSLYYDRENNTKSSQMNEANLSFP